MDNLQNIFSQTGEWHWLAKKQYFTRGSHEESQRILISQNKNSPFAQNWRTYYFERKMYARREKMALLGRFARWDKNKGCKSSINFYCVYRNSNNLLIELTSQSEVQKGAMGICEQLSRGQAQQSAESAGKNPWPENCSIANGCI